MPVLVVEVYSCRCPVLLVLRTWTILISKSEYQLEQGTAHLLVCVVKNGLSPEVTYSRCELLVVGRGRECIGGTLYLELDEVGCMVERRRLD
jgi:hypothetical protein